MIEPVTPDPPHRLGRLLSTQWWRDVTMLHWPVPPAVVRPLLPPGTEPDTLDGHTYVGLVAFLMDRVGPMGAPGVPYLGRFPETNVRLYSVDRRGRRGVVFVSMDAARLLPVLIARGTLRLPYVWSTMRVTRRDNRLTYTCRRRGRHGAAVTSRIEVRVGAPITAPSRLEDFLTARWALHTAWRGRTLYLRNVHPRWPLHRAELLRLDDSLLLSAGFGDLDSPPTSVLFSSGVPARFGWPTLRGSRG